MKIVTIKQALQRVTEHPEMETDDMLSVPVYELVTRTLFEIANGVQFEQRGSLTKATQARSMIFDRMVGKRKPGSHPARHETASLDFVDLTGGEVES